MVYKFTFKVVANVEAKNYYEANNKAQNILNKIVSDNFSNKALGTEIEGEYAKIMDTSNAHNSFLVDLINISYNYDPSLFKDIANVLAARDIDRCYEKNVTLPITDENLYDYLIEVSDDEDLKVIIGAIRPKDSEGNLLLYKQC